MNESPLISLYNHDVVGKNTPGKHADEGGNAWTRRIDKNGVQVQFALDGRKMLISPWNIVKGGQD